MRGKSSLLAAAALAMAGGLSGMEIAAPKSDPRPPRSTQSVDRNSWTRPGPGWSHAHVQRMAKKRRNQIKNRKAHRRARS